MRRAAGQSSLEMVITASAIIVVAVALSLYMRYASAGRLKAIGGSFSDVLFNSNTSRTTWTVPSQTTTDTAKIVGGVPALPGQPGIAGASVRTSETLTGGVTRRTDQL